MPNVWQELSRNVPEKTGTGAKVISATSVPGHQHVLVIGDQADGKYSVERLVPARTAEDGELTWTSASHVYDLPLSVAFERMQGMVMSAHSAAIQMHDIEERMQAGAPS